MSLGLYRLRKRLWAYKKEAHTIARLKSLTTRGLVKVDWRSVAKADVQRRFNSVQLPN